GPGDRMSYEAIAVLMFSTFMLLLLTGQRVFGAIGFVAAVFALALWGEGAVEMPFASTITLLNWYPMLTLPMFVYMGYMLSESGIASDLYRMFHVWTGPMRGGLAVGTILLMVAISAMNGLSVAGMAIGATIAMPELLKRGYDKIMVTGVIQAGSTLGIMLPPSVVLVLYGMIARQPVGQLWLAGVGPGLLLAALFIVYIVIRCHLQPHLGPPLPREEREQITWGEKIRLLRAGVLPLLIIFSMTGLFVMGVTSMVESSAVGALAATLVAAYKRRITWQVMQDTLRKSLAVSAMFMWIILAALAFGAVFDGLGAVRAIEVLFLEKWGLEPWQVLVLMQLTYIVMGTFLDDTAMLIIVAPLYVPLVIALGFNPIWYGILYTITCQIAYVTPPFGYNLFLMRAMAPKEVTLIDIYRSIVPFVLIMIVGLVLVIIYPEIALWLPEHVYVKSAP
ncbi:MAG TPA: TRAP transporter large permease subunit, partial [Steroidobacteraceae bacterium]|nr:TRAP transporter large permease subunit [Steroidobacteraceae bacterium]